MAPLAQPRMNRTYYDGKTKQFLVVDQEFKNNFWVNVAPINSVSKVNKINFPQVKTLVQSFFKQLETKQEYFQNVSIDHLFNYFIQGACELLTFAPSTITVELTSSKSIFLFLIKEKINIYFEIFFDETTGEFSEVVVNVYENKIQQLATSGSILNMIKVIEEHFKPVSINYYNYLESSYEIPGNITPSTTF